MAREQTTYTRIPEMGNLKLLHASYVSQSFSPHFHEGHVMGVILKGQLGFDYRGEKLVACPGQINLADPGAVHNGFAVSDAGWQYRMFYLGEGQLEAVLRDGRDKRFPAVGFKKGVIRDRDLAGQILCLHRAFENPWVGLLEKQSRFALLLRYMVLRHGTHKPLTMGCGAEQKAVRKIKSFLGDHFDGTVSLDDLSRESGLSKYYLIRVFSRRTGMTPHAWLTRLRAFKARDMMDLGMALADVAPACGFYDQSHMNRVFKKVFGITPGQYLAA